MNKPASKKINGYRIEVAPGSFRTGIDFGGEAWSKDDAETLYWFLQDWMYWKREQERKETLYNES